jgi:hypothetical protein
MPRDLRNRFALLVSQRTSFQWLRILSLFIGRLTIASNALQAPSFPKHLCIGRSPAQKIASLWMNSAGLVTGLEAGQRCINSIQKKCFFLALLSKHPLR